MQYMVYLFSVMLAVFHPYITPQRQAVVVGFCLQFEDLTVRFVLFIYIIFIIFTYKCIPFIFITYIIWLCFTMEYFCPINMTPDTR